MLVSIIVLRNHKKLCRLLRLLVNLNIFNLHSKFFSFHVLKDFLVSKSQMMMNEDLDSLILSGTWLDYLVTSVF